MRRNQVSFAISEYRKKGVLLRVFFSFLTLSLALMVLFFVFGLTILNDRYENETIRSKQDMLSKAQTALDIALQQTMDSLRNVSQNEWIISAVAVPNIKNVERSIKIVNHLQYVQQQSRYIKSVYFYSKFDNVVYPSKGSVGDKAVFYDHEVIDEHLLTRRYNGTVLPPEDRYQFFVYQGRVFLAYDFPLNAPYDNASVYAELDQSAIENIVDIRSQGSGETIQVFTSQNEPITQGGYQLTEVLNNIQNKESPVVGKNQMIFYHISPLTGWRYLYCATTIPKKLHWSEALLYIIPMLPIVMAMSIFISYRLTEYLYRPIRNMMNTISKTAYENKRGFKTELDYLDSVLSASIIRTGDLAKIVDVVRPEIEHKAFRSLLTGNPQECLAAENLLNEISSDINQKCVVLALQITDLKNQSLGKIESNMYMLAAKNVLAAFESNMTLLRIVDIEDNVAAVILTFSQQTSDIQISKEVQRLINHTQRKSSDFSFEILIAAGNTYASLHMLHASYLDACQLVNYQRYLVDDDATLDTTDCAGTIYQNYVKSQIGYLPFFLRTSDYEAAENLLTTTLNKVFHRFELNGEDLEHIKFYCNAFIDLMVGQLSAFQCIEELVVNRCAIEQQIATAESSSELLSYLQNEYQIFLTAIIQEQSKRQNKYIVAAKEYMNEHFSDYALSLDMVAQQIGIHSTYLSRLFKENLGVNFVDYINKQRVHKAKSLLITTRLTVKDIGFQTGFNSVQNYLRVFKKYEGITPTQYRDQYRQNHS